VTDPDQRYDPLAERERRLDAAEEYAGRLADAFRRDKQNTGPMEIVLGDRCVHRRLGEARRTAHRELRRADQPAQLEPPDYGVASRCIVDRASLDGTDGLPGVERLINTGQQLRVLPRLPVRLHLVDGRLAILRLRPDAALVVHPSALLDSLSRVFDDLWQQAVPLRQPVAPAGCATADEDERLVALLLLGLTDEAIARQLGVGYRTVQRRIAALMARLGSHSRFQAGVQLALRERNVRPDEPA
jgi:DNA-binding CsgD family transcriptional regulator